MLTPVARITDEDDGGFHWTENLVRVLARYYVFERLRADYVEKPDDSKLIESAINGMLAGLDPHSSYMDSKSFRDLQSQTRGEFGGLGIEVTMEDGLIKVVAPIDETPAAKAGIMANDIITHLD